jgi:hypothetical protein
MNHVYLAIRSIVPVSRGIPASYALPLFGCVEKLCSILKEEVLPTTLVFYSQLTKIMHSESETIMTTLRSFPLALKGIKSLTPFAIWGEVQNLHVIISASVCTLSLMSSMTWLGNLLWLLVSI